MVPNLQKRGFSVWNSSAKAYMIVLQALEGHQRYPLYTIIIIIIITIMYILSMATDFLELPYLT